MKLVRLTGTIYDHVKSEDILKEMVEVGAFNAAVASRELVVEASIDKLEDVKDALKRLKVTDIRVRETRLVETTVTQSGTGKDPDDIVKVYLAPAARVVGQKILKVLIEGKARGPEKEEELANIYGKFVRYVLQKAGVTDVVYSVEVLKKKSHEDMEKALELATINAIMAANGIIQINA